MTARARTLVAWLAVWGVGCGCIALATITAVAR